MSCEGRKPVGRASSPLGRLVARAGELLAIGVPRAVGAVPAELHVDSAGNEGTMLTVVVREGLVRRDMPGAGVPGAVASELGRAGMAKQPGAVRIGKPAAGLLLEARIRLAAGDLLHRNEQMRRIG